MGVLLCSMTSGSGCSAADGGPHYFAELDPEYGVLCLDCGAKPNEEG